MPTKTSSLIDAVHAEAPTMGGRCGVSLLRRKLDTEIAADLDQLLGDPEITATAISRGLKKLGYTCSPFTLQRHRRGSCGCTH